MTIPMNQVVVDRRNRPDDLVASGAVIDMRFRPGRRSLSLRAGKLLHLCVKAAGEDLTKPVKHKISLQAVRGIAKISSVEIKEIAMELASTLIEVHIFNPKERWLIGGIFADAEIDVGDGDLEFTFSNTMQKLFAVDERWAILSKTLILEFEGKYALRLFEIIALRRNMARKSEEFDLEEFRARLGVEPGKLILFGHFRAKALDPAVDEINCLTDMHVRYELIKKRRAVSGIRLHWSDTEATEKAPGKASEHKASETASPAAKPTSGPFPGRGGIGYTEPWATIARTDAPGHDMDLIAAAFRDHCVRQKIPLGAKAIETTFAGFCRAYAEKRRAASAA